MGSGAAVKDVYDARHGEVWMRIPTAVMDPASRLWRWVIGETALRIVDAGCSAVYLIRPDRTGPAGNPDIAVDMATSLRIVRLVCLPGDSGFRLHLDGQAQTPDLEGVNGLSHNASVGFGAGATAGRIRAEMDYLRFNPLAPRPPTDRL